MSKEACAACKYLRRKCTNVCIFAPYFPVNQMPKFTKVHKVFGASNVARILNELSPHEREAAVNSLAFEADAWSREPVYGCVGMVSILQKRLIQVRSLVHEARKELATYVAPQAMMPILQTQPFNPQLNIGNPLTSEALQQPHVVVGSSHQLELQHHQQQIFEAQQLAAAFASREQEVRMQAEMLRNFEQQQHQEQELLRYNMSGFNQMSDNSMPPSLTLGSFQSLYKIREQQQQENPHLHYHAHSLQALQPQEHYHAHSLQAQLFLESQLLELQEQQAAPQGQQQNSESDEVARCTSSSY